MSDRPPFIVELMRRDPMGPVLQIVALLAVAFFGYIIKNDVNTPQGALIAVWLIGFASAAVGVHRTLKSATRLRNERRTEKSARSPAPWDTDK